MPLRLDRRLTLLTLLLLPLLLMLGLWQLQRAEEKRVLQATQTGRAALPALPLAQLPPASEGPEVAFRRVEVNGYYHPEAMVFKDNQLRGGRYGVDVLGLFFDRGSGRWLLLNRGWVPADPARRSLPTVAIPGGEQRLLASVYVPPGEPYVLGRQAFDRVSWPLLATDPTAPALRRALRRRLDGAVYPHELRLAPGQPGGFRRDWPLANSSPQRHHGYALQWFTMAAVLLLLFVLRGTNAIALLRGGRGERS